MRQTDSTPPQGGEQDTQAGQQLAEALAPEGWDVEDWIATNVSEGLLDEMATTPGASEPELPRVSSPPDPRVPWDELTPWTEPPGGASAEGADQ
jgi:hypothetical protein